MSEKTNKFYLGLDLSTTCVGISLFNHEGKLIELKHLKLESGKNIPTEYRYIDKANLFKDFIISLKDNIKEKFNGEIVKVFLEEPLERSNNSFTSNILIKFNGICSYILYQLFGFPVELFSVYDVRKSFCPEFVRQKREAGEMREIFSMPKEIDKKTYIWKKVDKKYKNIEWIYGKKGELKKENFDMSDSIVVGEHGLKKHLII